MVEVREPVWRGCVEQAEIEYAQWPVAQNRHDATKRWWETLSRHLAQAVGCAPEDFGGFRAADRYNPNVTRLRNLKLVP